MAITAADVNKLRKMTGAGMMDCKKALTESNGDFEQAIDVLRKRGQKVAAKRADRDATEGAVISITSSDGTNGVIVSLNCETDFVAKNEGFVSLANKLAEVALSGLPSNRDSLLALEFETGLTVADKLIEQTGVIGEKLEIAYYESLKGNCVSSYIHAGNKLATLAALNVDSKEAAKNIAMQVAAMNPVALNKESVSSDVIERELEVARDQIRQEGKPEEMVDRIAQGKLGKFFKENTLVGQSYIKDSKQTVESYIGSIQEGAQVTGYRRVGLGV
ncbi:MAG: Elongation factor Ts [Owenweeksia sp. TMED14]|nr:MAG: Elongation factor Ts [Owenweeksia sp. TMED14]|tara:strand:+ start:6933 stop:7757 length:825 start_codon:yes stop_codon:yes gene_type:complete